MGLALKAITRCNRDEISRVLDIRNEKSIRDAMYTDHVISKEEHHRYVNSLIDNASHKVFLVSKAKVGVIGAAGFSKIDHKHRKCDWAFYLSSSARGIGSAIEWAMIEYAFSQLKMEKLNCEVIETNSRVVKLHKAFGFVEEGFRQENIIKNGERIGVYFLGLTKRDWQLNRDAAYSKFGRIVRANEVVFFT